MSCNGLEQAQKCCKCPKPQCSQHCLVNNDIPQITQLVCQGEYDKAMQVIGHPFGEVCSYVCPHFKTCVGNCVLNAKNNPVQVCQVERLVYEQSQYVLAAKSDKLQGVSVAVIGGGVAGVTFACKTYEQGASVTVFCQDKLLSTLDYISAERLPRSVIDKVRNVFDGTSVKTEHCYVDKAMFDDIVAKFDVVYVACGLDVEYGLGVDGENLAESAFKFLSSEIKQSNVGIIGGGNTAMDCAREVISHGGQATVLYRRTRQDMPAFVTEIDDVSNLGCKFVFNVAPVSLRKTDSGVAITLCKTVSNGREKLVLTDEQTTMQFDTVVTALGAKFGNGLCLPDERGNVLTDEFGKVQGYINVFAGGDITLGESLVGVAVNKALTTAKYVTDNFGKE